MVWAWKARSRHFVQPLAPKVAVITTKRAYLPKNALFDPKVPLPAPLRKALYKHKHLGCVLEVQSRKSAILAQKVRNSAPKPGFHQKAVLGAKMTIFAKRLQTAQNTTILL